jgi:hypothetical protein
MFESKVDKGQPNGYASLDIDSKIPTQFLPPDIYVTGGTYDNITGSATFTNTLDVKFSVSGFTTGVTDWYAENATPPTIAPVASGTSSIAIGDNAQALTNDMFVYGTGAGVGTTNSQKANFIGYYAGNGAIGAYNSNFIGVNAGQNATRAYKSNFIGHRAGLEATNADHSNFIGRYAGYQATNANSSNFIGYNTGQGATGASNSNFLGNSAGYQATNANDSNFLGNGAGYQATNANDSNFLGNGAGQGATAAHDSNFLGNQAGQGATGASRSNFFGIQAGYNAKNANDSNFFGYVAGQLATDAYYSNFFGFQAGVSAKNARFSNLIGYYAGVSASGASFSNLFGYRVGYNIGNSIGSNNIIIGTNISLSAGKTDSINIGGVLFGTGTYNNAAGDTSSEPNDGKIGINVVNPTNALHISASTDSVRIENLTTNTSDGDILSIDATGVIHRYPISGLSTSIISINSQTSGYVLSLSDQNKIVEMSAATSITVTVPAYSAVSYPTGVQILLVRGGVGDVSVVADSSVTIKSANNYLSLNNQYSPATLLKVGTNTWYLFGDLKS